MIQFENDFVTVELANNSTTIIVTWKGFIPSSYYRDALTKSLEIAKTHKIKKWISDIKLMKVIGTPDQEWAGTTWLLDAVSSGCYEKQAVIMSEDIFGKASANKILTTVQDKAIEIRNFVNLEDAKKWLA